MMNKNKLQGIYKITNKVNGNTYIGQTKDLQRRIEFHKVDLKHGKHSRSLLQEEYNLLVENYKELNKNNCFYDYIDFDSYTFDINYHYELMKHINDNSFDSILDIEDEYIIKYAKGYDQKTNKDIKEYSKNKSKVKKPYINSFKKYKDSLITTVIYNNYKYILNKNEYYEKLKYTNEPFLDFVYTYLLYMYSNNIALFDMEDYKRFVEAYVYEGAKMYNNQNKSANKSNAFKSLEKLKMIISSKDLIKDKANKIKLNIDLEKLNITFYNYIVSIDSNLLDKAN